MFQWILEYCRQLPGNFAPVILGLDLVKDCRGFFFLPAFSSENGCCARSIMLHRIDTSQVIERANDSEYGLASGVFSESLDEVNIISRGLKAGTVW